MTIFRRWKSFGEGIKTVINVFHKPKREGKKSHSKIGFSKDFKYSKRRPERIPRRRISASPQVAIVSSSQVASNVENVTTL